MKKILISLISLLLMLPLVAQGAWDAPKLQDLGVKMVDKRVSAIVKYDGLLTQTKNISEPVLTQVKGELSRVSGELDSIKTKILGETDTGVLKEDIKSIVNNYRAYQVFLPQSAGLVAIDRLLTFQYKLVELSNKIGQKASDLEAQGKDVAQIRELVQSAGVKLNSAGDNITGATAKFSAMTISDPEAAKSLKIEGKQSLLDARKDFTDAKKSLKEAVQAIKELVK
ncbi:MAG: hypothetical protein ABIG90_01180 [bacterium]